MGTSFPIEAKVSPAIKDIKALEDALRKAGKEANLTEKQINDIVKATTKARNDGTKNFNQVNGGLNQINKTLSSGTKIIATYFAVDRIKAFISSVVQTRAEFEKMEAVLANTLGSKGAAQRALKELIDIGAKTPFSVLQLTQSYVKLVNQGIKPTREEIIKLGDLAASTGKQFDQLTEAIIDAQTGEFERLKEFGIRASKQGDQVTFTFKGMQTQVAFTTDAIKNYIFSLGEAEGVSGAMAAISATMGGKISNAGDAVDSFNNALGRLEKGPIVSVIDAFIELTNRAAEIISIAGGDPFADFFNAKTAKDIELFNSLGRDDQAKFINQLVQDIGSLKNELEEIQKLNAPLTGKETDAEITDRIINAEKYKFQLQETGAQLTALQDEYKELYNLYKAPELKEKQEREKAEVERRERLNKAWEKHNELIRKYNRQIADLAALEDTIKVDDSVFAKFGLSTSGGKFGDIIGSLEPPPEEEGLTDREFNQIKARVDAHKEAVDTMRDYTIDAFEEVFRSRIINSQREIAILDAQYQYEIAQAGNNEQAKQNITKRFEQQRIALLNKQAQQQQQAAIFSILANQGPAVAKTASTLGFPLAIPFIAAVLGLFALTLSNQKQVQPPKFAAEGDFDIKGPGTETSDSIPYMLSVRETVNPARNTKRFGWLLGPMVKKKDFNEYDLRHLVDKNLPNEYNPVFFNQARGADSPEMLEELRATRRAIENKKETHITYNEEGFNTWIGKENEWTRRMNKRYST